MIEPHSGKTVHNSFLPVTQALPLYCSFYAGWSMLAVEGLAEGEEILLANRAARFHGVDTRRIMLKYCERWAIFRNELSRLVRV